MNERIEKLNARAVVDKIQEMDGRIREFGETISRLEREIAQLRASNSERTQLDFENQARYMGSGPTA